MAKAACHFIVDARATAFGRRLCRHAPIGSAENDRADRFRSTKSDDRC